MADGSSSDVMTTIDELLAKRQQYEGWIARIDEAGEAPDAVRLRVREDYRQRLEETTSALREHAGDIADQLADYRGQEDDLTQRATALQEALAEAQLRHAVGEYDEEKWKELSGAHDAELEEARKVLARITGEIERLVEVQALITAEPDVPDTPAGAPGPTVGAPAPEAAADATPAAGAPRFEPRPQGKGNQGPPKTLVVDPAPASDPSSTPPEDELAFLKSVTEESRPAPKAEPPARPAGAKPAGGTPAAPRTLKCGECGSMNRPTEWYCEKCGAELAAL